MSDLGQTKMPWMTTAYGWVFMGYEPVDDEDYAELEAYLATGGISIEDVTFDDASLVGRLAREYTAEIWERGETGTPKMGGEGSHTYETQRIIGKNYGSGDVMFKDEGSRDIWHINPIGERVYGQLDYGDTGRSYHVDQWGQSTAGPKPGTRAATYLGEDRYAFQEKNAWWVVRRT